MRLIIEQSGVQASLQGAKRDGWRHLGVPQSGAADSLAQAIANYLCGNQLTATTIELSLIGGEIRFEGKGFISLAGGLAACSLTGAKVAMHQSIEIADGDVLKIGTIEQGARMYLAVAGEMQIRKVMQSTSTCITAKFGGLHGVGLRSGDVIEVKSHTDFVKREISKEYILAARNDFVVRACVGPEFDLLDTASKASLFEKSFIIGRRADRMGVQLIGQNINTANASIASAPVFSGTVQSPPDGSPFILLNDGQTTGGYPRIAQIIRADLHLLGQLKAGSEVRLRRTSASEAARVLQEKSRLFTSVLGGSPF